MRIPAGLSAAPLVAAVLCSASARAQAPSVDARQFRPSTDPAGLLYLESPLTPGAGQLNVGAWFSYALRPDIVRAGSGDLETYLISYQASTDLMANIGITPKGSLGVDMPLVLLQTGSWNPTTRALLASPVPKQALGDLAVTGKVNLLSYDSLGGLGLGVLGRLTLPTGDASAFVGEGATTGEIRMLAEYKLIALSLQVTAGAYVRAQSHVFAGRAYGNEVPWGAAIVLRPQAFGIDDGGRMTWAAELHGAYALAPSSSAEASGARAAVSPVLAGLFARYEIVSGVSAMAGVDFGITHALGDPLARFSLGLSWAPRANDSDHDGVDDDHDQCPELAEDRDGFEDDDGCPDPDNDGDGVPDAQDRCPDRKEDIDGFQDDDGCPDSDNDRDKIPDKDDACPDVKGVRSTDPKRNGCPLEAPAPAAAPPAPPPTPAKPSPTPASKPGRPRKGRGRVAPR